MQATGMQWTYRIGLPLGVVAGIAATVATHLAAPDCDEGAGVTVGAAPRQDVAIGGLDDGEYVTRALICHLFPLASDALQIWSKISREISVERC